MLKQYVERKTVTSHCLLSAEANVTVDEETDTEEFGFDDRVFPTAKQPQSYNDVSVSDALTSEQRAEVEALIEQYLDVLTSVPGRTDLIQHDIKLSTSEPIRSKGYPVPYKARDVMDSEIKEMLELGVIEKSVSPYSSPVVLVPKKDGSVRFCIDFRKLNKVTEFDAEPMPNMEEVIKTWIFTETWEAHMTSLCQVLDRLRSAKLTAKPSKCFIGYSSIECLGHNIVGQTMRPQEDKIQAITEATRPQTKRQMKSFLGLAGFYRRFIPSFSSIASPLTDLTKKDRPNSIKDWQDKHEKAFKTLKTRLTSSPILRLPVFRDEIPFVLRTDASDVGVGAVLKGKVDSLLHMPARNYYLGKRTTPPLKKNVWE